MPIYKAPVEDVSFLLNDVFQIDRYDNLPGFSDASADVRDAIAEYDPALKTYCAIDSGVWTGALWFQFREYPTPRITVFHCYLTEGLSAERNARAIKDISTGYGCRIQRYCTDPAGGEIHLIELERLCELAPALVAQSALPLSSALAAATLAAVDEQAPRPRRRLTLEASGQDG